MVELTELNLDKIYGHVNKVESPKFDGIFAGYEVIPPVMVKQRINTMGLWCEPKERHIFRKVLKMTIWMVTSSWYNKDMADDDESECDE
eukprot:12743026-Ditylum_brightwellii.AAC.1